MNIHVLPYGPVKTNGFLLTEPDLKEAVMIDAPGGVCGRLQQILEKEGCRLKELWITHGHWDHTLDGAAIVRATGAKVRAHDADRTMIESPKVMSVFMTPGCELEPIAVDHWLSHGERIPILGRTAKVRHVPGHCPGNVIFYFDDPGAVFVGDALFHRGIGRTDLPGGDFTLLAKSIREQIYTLPDATIVHSGHGPETTVLEERSKNPFVTG